MNTSNTSSCALSPKRYAIARIVKYLQLLIVVLFLFVPILQITSTDFLNETTVTEKASISVIQFLTNNAESDITLSYSGSMKDSSFLSEMLKLRIDVLKEMFGSLPDGMLATFQIGTILIGLLIASLSLLTSRSNAKSMLQNSSNSMQLQISNGMYITKVYDTLPKALEFIEKTIFGILFGSCLFFNILGIAIAKIDSTSWSVNIIPSLIVLSCS